MEPLLIILSTAIGTVVGVICAVFLMQRRGRLPDSVDARKISPENLASVVAAPTVTIEDLRGLLAERDQTLQQSRDDLQNRQQQLDAALAETQAALAEVQNVTALRNAAEQRGAELATQTCTFADQLKELDIKVQELSLAAEEAKGQLAPLETQLDLEKRQNQELAEQNARLAAQLNETGRSTGEQVISLAAEVDLHKRQSQELAEQIARLAAELTESRLSSGEQAAAIANELGLEKRQSAELAEQVRVLTIDLGQSRQSGAQALEYRASLEAELGVGREQITLLNEQVVQLNDRVAELSRERLDFEVRLREERESAAKGLELLTLLQSTLSGAFHKVHEEAPNGNGSAPRPEVVVNAKTEELESSPKHREAETLVPAPGVEADAVTAEAVAVVGA